MKMQMIERVESDRLAALYRLALTLRMRQLEILGLRLQDVDLDTDMLRVRQTLQSVGGTTVIKEPKTARSRRTLALSPSLIAALTAHKDGQAFERDKAAQHWQEGALVFTTSTRTPLEAHNLVREFKRHLGTAALPHELPFYAMRYAAASLLIADDLPVTAVSALPGNALTSTTRNNYARSLPGSDRIAADAMERSLG